MAIQMTSRGWGRFHAGRDAKDYFAERCWRPSVDEIAENIEGLDRAEFVRGYNERLDEMIAICRKLARKAGGGDGGAAGVAGGADGGDGGDG